MKLNRQVCEQCKRCIPSIDELAKEVIDAIECRLSTNRCMFVPGMFDEGVCVIFGSRQPTEGELPWWCPYPAEHAVSQP